MDLPNKTKHCFAMNWHNSMRGFLAFIQILFFAACSENMLKDEDISNDLSLLSQSLSKEFGKLGLSDAANGGLVDEFYFMDLPGGKQPKYFGKFHPNLQPVVEISDDLTFGSKHAVFSRNSDSSLKVTVDVANERYSISWKPSDTKAQVGKIYRIRVKIGEKVLGYKDVGIVPSSKTQKLQDGVIPVVYDQVAMTTFRLEEKECPARIEVTPYEATVLINGQQQYKAVVYNFYGEVLPNPSINWRTGDSSIATMNNLAIVTGHKLGFTEVIAEVQGLTGKALVFVQEAAGEYVPRPGKDIVVLNDVNPFFGDAILDPNNVTFVKNLVNYDAPEVRGSGSKIWFDCGRNSAHVKDQPGPCQDSNRYNTMRNIIRGEGFSLEDISSSAGTLIDIPIEVKVIFLWLPRINYSVAEINALKKFANEGGRIVFIGEWDVFYGSDGIAIQNQFLVNMGAVMRNIGQAVDCLYQDGFGNFLHPRLPGTSLRAHPITRDMAHLTIACASVIELGPADYPLFYDTSNTKVLAGVAQIDTELITELKNARVLPIDQKRMRVLGEPDAAKTGGK